MSNMAPNASPTEVYLAALESFMGDKGLGLGEVFSFARFAVICSAFTSEQIPDFARIDTVQVEGNAFARDLFRIGEL